MSETTDKCQFCGQQMWTDHGDGTMSRHTPNAAECDRTRIANLESQLAAKTAECERLRQAANVAMVILRDCEALSVNFKDTEAFALDNAAEQAYCVLKAALLPAPNQETTDG